VHTRILHVSDLHVGARGARDDLAAGAAISALVERLAPELVVATGDLTHLGRAAQHEAAARLLHGLGRPLLVVPGNHDIPFTLPGRFTRTWRNFERHWQTTEPVYSSISLHAIGLNSVRPWRHQSGGIRTAQLRRAAERLEGAPAGALRVAALHHQLVGAPWRTRKRPVARRNHVLARLVDCGAELILGGHIHQAAVCERHEFEVVPDAARGVVVSIAPGFGRPRPDRRGEARGVVAYRADERRIEVETYIWRREGWNLTATRAFPRNDSVLVGPPAT
jgi:3',5'-cyclic AMP phosphodiesterase CpdA